MEGTTQLSSALDSQILPCIYLLGYTRREPTKWTTGTSAWCIETVHKWDMRQLHFFVTSRDEPNIRKVLDQLATQKIGMQNAGTNEDIANFISDRLNEDRKLQKMSLYHDKIGEALVKRARGV